MRGIMKKHYSIRKAELIYVNQGIRRALRDTLVAFRAVVKYLEPVILTHWDDIISAETAKGRKNIVEALIHKTKANPSPLYKDFDELFYKLPSYYRRSAIEFVIGAVSSYKTRQSDYEIEKHDAMSNGRKFHKKPPRLNLDTNACPTLYKDNMFKVVDGKLLIKAFIRNTWNWIEVSIPRRDNISLMKASEHGIHHCPKLVFRYNKFYLDFPFEFRISKFPETKIQEQTVLGVDLGINHGAVCSAVDAYGYVHARGFDPFSKERASIQNILEKIRYVSKKTGSNSLASLYTKLQGLKENYVRQLARWIVNYAIEAGVYGIVLENLGGMKGRGRHKDRIHHWCKRNLQKLIKGMAFREGIRVFIINPRNTSALAFDGSGKVERNKTNFSLCTFASGKQYHCDLNASYNIAARYFLRAIQNAMQSDAWAQLVAKVPCVAKRTNCTLATLRSVAKIVYAKASA